MAVSFYTQTGQTHFFSLFFVNEKSFNFYAQIICIVRKRQMELTNKKVEKSLTVDQNMKVSLCVDHSHTPIQPPTKYSLS